VLKLLTVLAISAGIEKTGCMRGAPDPQLAMLSSLSTEDLIPGDHPIRRIRVVVDAVLAELDETFDGMYASGGPRSIPPETLLKATVLMAMYSIRSERAFCERLNYDLLFKWFLDMRIDQAAFDATTFSKNRQRLLDHEVADEFFAAVVRQAKLRRYISSDHFSVDGTLLQAWASHKSFKPKNSAGEDGTGNGPKGRNAEVQWHGQKRSYDTHVSTTDPESRLYRKSSNTAATLCYSGHLLMENRHALIVDAELSTADGYAERATALEMLARLPASARRRTVAGDKNYDTKGFVTDARELGFTPHVAQNTSGTRRSAIDGRTTRHAGHEVSMRIRKRIEEPFGWVKTVGGGRKLRYIGRQRNRAWFKITTATYNLIRIAALDTQLA
jgi:transposase